MGATRERPASPADVTPGVLLLILGPMSFFPILIRFRGFDLGTWEEEFLLALFPLKRSLLAGVGGGTQSRQREMEIVHSYPNREHWDRSDGGQSGIRPGWA